MKVGDLVEHMFDGEWQYGIILEIDKDNPNMILVQWLCGRDRYHPRRNLTVIGEA
tara:strand:+ start:340 stop:504 length:165 start_codon:yes stop_codon:yes gene_type:complete